MKIVMKGGMSRDYDTKAVATQCWEMDAHETLHTFINNAILLWCKRIYTIQSSPRRCFFNFRDMVLVAVHNDIPTYLAVKSDT